MTAVRRFLSLLPLPFLLAPRHAARVFAVASAVALALPAQAADTGSAWTLDRLMSTLAQHKSGRATFTETKTLSIAAQPLESSGELVFVAPDHLEKHTLSPKPEHLVVDGDMLTVERNNRKFTLALARYPELGAFIDSIRATLAGNRYALEQVYKVALAGHGDDWTLTLTPLDSRMLKVISTITLDGTRDVLRSVAIRQADGDHSTMHLQPVPAN
ncbi:outer membrane lipoprotein carrier protein LolA [Burkholderia ambifaria]|jgi:outer membrane lipoprotein-sorting protein|uniref:outer membrane lipoprotein carrier protein LolA n=1 Tax=Burkholderia ambifaria TaxID=152480 RepID=UPI001BA3A196|nr:outer membrane lipoprotein carrier protein LolA [Burkholderia ambifaria]MBR8180586.1 outer membrane lipoprotein carrier protein LolA [Burkholderia ambifaria]